MNSIGIAILRCFLDLGPAGITESDRPCDLIKGLAGSIIAGVSQDVIMAVIIDHNNMGMASADDQA